MASTPDAPPWRGAELFTRDDWKVRLSEHERDELMRSIEVTRDVRAEDVSPKGLELPVLARGMERVRRDLEVGAGAALLSGLPPDLDDESFARALWILALQLGTPLSQGADGRRLLAVRDEGFAPGDPRFRGPHSRRRLSFHTDRCDLIGFACVRPAAQGGENHLLHSRALRDALRARCPEHAATLERDPLPYLRHTVDAGNARPFTLVPVFSEHAGRFAASLLRVLIDRADASPLAPDLTDAQRAALDALEEVAEDSALIARLRLERGDVLLLNNWVTFHRRTAFEDAAEPAEQRLLYRVWISSPASRALDPRYREHFGATEAGALRGGMRPRADT